jgi:hypothetical protein
LGIGITSGGTLYILFTKVLSVSILTK